MQIKCTSCGAIQELAANQQCDYCGSAIEQEKAQENYNQSTTGEVGNLMMMADTAVDATNWEEAFQYYNKALEKNITNSDAWLGKGIAIIYTSKLGDIKTKEAISYWKNAIKHAENADAMGKRVAKEINTVVNSFYPAIENHYKEYSGLDKSYQELVSRFSTLESAQDYATQLDKEAISYAETGYELCKRVIDLPLSDATAQFKGAVDQFTNNGYADNHHNRRVSINASKLMVEKTGRMLEIYTASLTVEGIKEKYLKLISIINPKHRVLQEIEEKKSLNQKELSAKKINTFFISNGKFFEGHQMNIIREKLVRLDDSKWDVLSTAKFKDPTTILFFSIFIGGFGIDRFMIGDIGLGVGKLLTCGGFGIWTIIDWFMIQKATRKKNMQKLNIFCINDSQQE
jgi:TM2 domain-containing membrane protein YozV